MNSNLSASGLYARSAIGREGVLAAMDHVRQVCRDRSAERVHELALRFEGVLAQFRATSPDHHRSASMVSIALDRFVSEARSAVEVAAAPAEASSAELARIEQALATLNHMYVASEQAVSVRTMAPASFMLGAESVALNVLREVREAANAARQRQLEVERERELAQRRSAEQARQRRADVPRPH